MVIDYIGAKTISYGKRRNVRDVKAIVIHNTGNNNDTAINNARYYKNGNKDNAGAHFFVDQKGNIVQSIGMHFVAWSVGGDKWDDCYKTGGGRYYKKYTNDNTVSIELCDIVNRDPSKKMIKAVIELIAHIRYTCPNAKTIIRHFDVNGKHCPQRMMDDKAWDNFLKDIKEPNSMINKPGAKAPVEPSLLSVRIKADSLNIRSVGSTKGSIIGKVKKGEVCTISKVVSGWGKLHNQSGWINISSKYVTKIL